MLRLQEKVAVAALLPVRLFAGAALAAAGIARLRDDWLGVAPCVEAAQGWAAAQASGFLTPAVRGVVHSHPKAVAWALALGPTIAGFALLAGLLSRPMAVVGLLATLFLWAARGDGPASATAALAAVLATLVLAGSGRSLGLDAWLKGKLPRWLA